MNQNFNKLPRRAVSSNKNTGKIVDSINLSLITDSSNVITDHCYEYYNSKFQFSDFFNKDISNAKNLTGYYVVKNDDFVYNPRISNFAPVGPIKRNKLGRTGVMSPLYYVFRTHDIDKDYFEKYFDTKEYADGSTATVGGATDNNQNIVMNVNKMKK